MRKFSCLILIIILLAASFPNDYAQASNGTKSSSVAVPITTGLVGSNNSAKSFYLDLPSGVTSSAILHNTLNYTGNNQTIGSINIENGKIKVTLKGTENKKFLKKLKGIGLLLKQCTRLKSTIQYGCIQMEDVGKLMNMMNVMIE